MSDESMRAIFESERERLATLAPEPRFGAIERRIEAARVARLDRLARLCTGAASAVLLAAILVATAIVPGSRLTLVLAAALVWTIMDQGLSPRLSR